MTAKTPFDEIVSGPPAVVEEQLAIVPTGMYSMDPEFGFEDISKPRLRLGQGLTKEVSEGDAKAGDWLLLGYDPTGTVELVPIGFQRVRTLRDEDRSLLCSGREVRGEDGKLVKVGNTFLMEGVGDPGGNCQACPMAQWSEGVDSKGNKTRKAPPCDFAYSYVCWSLTHGTLVQLDFQKTALPAGRFLNALIGARGIGAFRVLLTSSQQKGARGPFYTPSVRKGDDLTDNELEAVELAQASLAS